MIKRVLKLGVLILIGWIIYVQFWGTEEQLDKRKNLFQNVKKTGQSIGEIVKTEKIKLKDVSFKEALGNIGGSIDKIKKDTEGMGQKTKEKVQNIEQKKKELDELLEKLNLKKEAEITEEEQGKVKEKLTNIKTLMEKLSKDIETEK